MFCVTLTGGIASGKSAASRFFSQQGAAVIDCDEISRSLTASGGEAIPLIRTCFGDIFIDDMGSMDRARMRSAVFFDDEARLRLERLLHPLIMDKAQERFRNLSGFPYALVVVPVLLEESFWAISVQRILVIRCDPLLQRERLRARGLSSGEIGAILKIQEKLVWHHKCDDLIENNGELESLESLVKHYHRRYCIAASEWERK
ncbi:MULTISPECIES: dephospho-CoA kinase [Candidatus Ichthyocystis]|uniref:Dephospho-CoA kinase n=1 Tax=Candidatus Ichthyocystis hellenicum TaxID=1561003 RepID=A0A0S4M010_9BURK|nr:MULTISPECIES: dephospho-CoA kinase [Ichthyocystis]CUT16945.1 Dephospho-CoA kinase [Candidatus Ichthyocystis hellenicum]